MNPTENEHIFSGHLLSLEHSLPVLRLSSELIWPSFYLFACLSILALIKKRALARLIRIVQSTFSNQILKQLEREELNALKFYSIALNSFFVLNLTFLIYKINAIYKIVLVENSSIAQFSFFFLSTLLLISFKTIANSILSFFTDSRRLITDYSINSTLVNQTFGLFLFPLIVLLEFTDFNQLVFILCASLLLLTAIILKWYRGIIMGLIVERVGLLQIFSYFCALEILPLLVMAKYIFETY